MATLSEHIREKIINVAYGTGLGILAAICSFNYFHGRLIQPYSGIEVKTDTPEVPVGGPLVIRVSGTRDRICAVEVSRAYISLKTGEMVHQERVPAGFVPLGPFSVPISMQLPTFMEAGPYVFKGQQINDCGQEVITIPYPDVTFRVVSQN